MLNMYIHAMQKRHNLLILNLETDIESLFCPYIVTVKLYFHFRK